jgi:hypothetical protein
MHTPPRHKSPDGHCPAPVQSSKPPPGQPPPPEGVVHEDVVVPAEKQQMSGDWQFAALPQLKAIPRHEPAATQ